MDRNKAIAYVQSALSFVFSDAALWEKPVIKKIVLFGSAARSEATPTSDLDLFFEVYSINDIVPAKKRLDFALGQFAKSRQYREWGLIGIKNEIRPFVSTLNRSSDLQKSLVADGIVLYGEFAAKLNFQHYILVSFAPIKNKNKRYKIDRYLFGRKEERRVYPGRIQQSSGVKIDARTFILPSLQAEQILKLLRKGKINFLIRDFWAESLK